MKKALSRFSPRYIPALLYMLQSSEYHVGTYVAWLRRARSFNAVAKRRMLDYTPKIKLLALGLWILSIICVAAFGWLIYQGITEETYLAVAAGVIGLLALPWALAYIVVVPLFAGYVIIQRPREKKIIKNAAEKLKSHKGLRIAVAGSYGKTTAKEVIKTILAEGKKVAATPGNMNTMIGNSRFISKLNGDEDIIIFELGESHVGDVIELCELTQPDMGVITGISEAHLESFESVENITSTIFELQDFLGAKPLYKNVDSPRVADMVKSGDKFAFSHNGVGEWQVNSINQTAEGLSFVAVNRGRKVHARTHILGEHNVGILVVAIDIAAGRGLSDQQIEEGLSKVVPFDHRMQPYQLHGAWIIDDTYNGNSEGVRVGLHLLAKLPAKRRIYVTPGLVEQGSENEAIHNRIGEQAAKTADMVVLMKNSVTDYIVDGLNKAKFKGELRIVEEPLEFYQNLDQFVVPGDVVLMQNDWTDNYA